MKKISALLFLSLLLCSCGSSETKYSVGDTWVIQLLDNYSVECNFKEIVDNKLFITIKNVNMDDSYGFAIMSYGHYYKGEYNYVTDVFANNEEMELKVIEFLPMSFYVINPFEETNEIELWFDKDIDVFKKINLRRVEFYLRTGLVDNLGIDLELFTY